MGTWLQLGGDPFITFGTSHLTMISIYFLGLLIFFLSLKYIRLRKKAFTMLRWGLFTVLILSEVSYQVWTAATGIWSLKEHMPLHLCGIAGITGAIALATYNKKIIQITFFIGLVPAFLAVITPELPYDYPHFRFWKFFVHHIAISWASIFLICTTSAKITFKNMLETYGYLLIYAFIIGAFINPYLHSNYLYLSHTPTASTPLDMLGSGFWYYLNLCLLGLIVFTVQQQLYKLFTHNKRAFD